MHASGRYFSAISSNVRRSRTGHILIEREDEIAEEHVGAGVDQRLRHAEAVERADHQHALAAQLDAKFVLHEAHRVAFERVF